MSILTMKVLHAVLEFIPSGLDAGLDVGLEIAHTEGKSWMNCWRRGLFHGP
jgi:hypothetical protein